MKRWSAPFVLAVAFLAPGPSVAASGQAPALITGAALVQEGPAFGSAQATAAEDERLRQLQIKKLEHDLGWQSALTPLIPLASVLIAVGGAVFGILKYLRDQRLERSLRIEEGISSNLERLVDYPASGKSLSGVVVSALRSLEAMCAQSIDGQAQREAVADAILTVVLEDVDFDNPQQAVFDDLCLTHWPPYQVLLARKRREHEFILYRYRRALEKLHEADADYFSTISLVPDGSFEVSDYTDETRYRHFLRLVHGFKQQLRLLKDPATRRREVNGFAEALDNPRLTKQLFGDVSTSNGLDGRGREETPRVDAR